MKEAGFMLGYIVMGVLVAPLAIVALFIVVFAIIVIGVVHALYQLGEGIVLLGRHLIKGAAA